MDKTPEWCNSFVSVPKPNGTVHLCIDPARLTQALIRLVHRGPAVNDMFLRLTNVQYVTLIDANSGHLKLKLNKKVSYLTTFECQFGR